MYLASISAVAYISVYDYISVYKHTCDFAQYNTLYIRQLICHHFVHCLSGSGEDCTQNHCTVLAQTNQALCNVICSRMNTINVIENGRAGNSLHTYVQICFLCNYVIERLCKTTLWYFINEPAVSWLNLPPMQQPWVQSFPDPGRLWI